MRRESKSRKRTHAGHLHADCTDLCKVYAHIIEALEKPEKVVNVHCASAHFLKSIVNDNAKHHFLHVEVGWQLNAIECAHGLVVLLKQLVDSARPKARADRLVLAHKGYAHKAVPLLKVDGRRRVAGLQAHNARLNLGRGAEVVLAHLHEVVHPREQLCVDRQAAVQCVAGLCDETLCKFALEHEHRTSEERPVQQQLEHKRRRNLIWHVGNTHVKKGKLSLQKVADNNFEFALFGSSLDTLLEFSNETSIDLRGNDLLHLLQHLHRQISRTRTDLKDSVRWSQSRLVHNALDDKRILQNVLAKRLVELDALPLHGLAVKPRPQLALHFRHLFNSENYYQTRR
eukprot:Opistho-2@33260